MSLTYLLNIIFSLLLLSNRSNQREIILKAELTSSQVTRKEDLLATLELSNRTDSKVFTHKYSGFNYQSSCLGQHSCLADYYFVVQKKEKDNYIDLEEIANIDEVPGYDSLGNPHEFLFNTLLTGQSETKQFNILGYYRLQKGEYRVRFSYRLPKRNNQQSKIVYSAWLAFEVKSERVEYMY